MGAGEISENGSYSTTNNFKNLNGINQPEEDLKALTGKGRFATKCLDFKRVATAGSLNLQCFDKTGTLTQEGLDFYGVRGITD